MKNIWFNVAGGIMVLAIVMGVGRFAYTPILPLMQNSVEFSQTAAGYLASINNLGYLIGALFAGLFSWKEKRDIFLKIFLIINIISTILMGLVNNFGLWMLIRLITGITSGICFVLISSLILDLLVVNKRLNLSGVLYSGVGLGICTSGILVPVFDSFFNWRGAWIGLGVLCFIVCIIFWRGLTENNKSKSINTEKEVTNKLSNKFLPWLTFAYGCEGFGYIISGTFLVALIGNIPELKEIAFLSWVFVGLSAIPSSFLWSQIAEKYGYVVGLILAYLIQVFAVILPVISPSFFGVLLGAFLFGGTFMGITTLATSAARKSITKNSSKIIGIMTAVYGVGQVMGPAIAGILVERTGNYNIALFLAAGSLLLGIFLIYIGNLISIKEGRETNNAIC